MGNDKDPCFFLAIVVGSVCFELTHETEMCLEEALCVSRYYIPLGVYVP